MAVEIFCGTDDGRKLLAWGACPNVILMRYLRKGVFGNASKTTVQLCYENEGKCSRNPPPLPPAPANLMKKGKKLLKMVK